MDPLSRYQQFVGPVSYLSTDLGGQGSKRLVVASESGVLAAINSRTGNISKEELRVRWGTVVCTDQCP